MTTSRHALVPALALAAALLLGACGDDDDGSVAADPTEETTQTTDTSAVTETSDGSDGSEEPAGGDVVTMEQSRYEPQSLEVSAGTEVTFENLDPYAHTVTSAEGSPVEFDSGQLGPDETFTQTFDDAGTYEFFCQIHPTMQAEVVVS